MSRATTFGDDYLTKEELDEVKMKMFFLGGLIGLLLGILCCVLVSYEDYRRNEGVRKVVSEELQKAPIQLPKPVGQQPASPPSDPVTGVQIVSAPIPKKSN